MAISPRCAKWGGGLAPRDALGDWVTIDAKSLSQLCRASGGQVEATFAECELQHLLKVRLGPMMLDTEAPLTLCEASARVTGKDGAKPGHSPASDDANDAASSSIRSAIANGASDAEARVIGLEAALTAGADKEASGVIVDTQLRLGHAHANWEEGQAVLEYIRSCSSELAASVSKDLVCPITNEMFVAVLSLLRTA